VLNTGVGDYFTAPIPCNDPDIHRTPSIVNRSVTLLCVTSIRELFHTDRHSESCALETDVGLHVR
jgi:hypothetical protein